MAVKYVMAGGRSTAEAGPSAEAGPASVPSGPVVPLLDQVPGFAAFEAMQLAKDEARAEKAALKSERAKKRRRTEAAARAGAPVWDHGGDASDAGDPGDDAPPLRRSHTDYMAALEGKFSAQRQAPGPRPSPDASWSASRASLLCRFYRAAPGRADLVRSRVQLRRASMAYACPHCSSAGEPASGDAGIQQRPVPVALLSIEGFFTVSLDVPFCTR